MRNETFFDKFQIEKRPFINLMFEVTKFDTYHAFKKENFALIERNNISFSKNLFLNRCYMAAAHPKRKFAIPDKIEIASMNIYLFFFPDQE